MTEIPPLDLAQVQRLLGGRRFGRHIHHEVECASTNVLARQLMTEGAPTGSVVVAESQSAGRGRFQRAWTSSPGQNLLFSVIVRWPRGGAAPSWLTLAGALAVCHSVEELYHLETWLKWPNDVVLTLGHGVQKLAGVLAEAAPLSTEEQGAVVGIGLNVNQVWRASEQDPERPRVSLAAALGRMVDREPLLAATLSCLEDRVDGLMERGPRNLMAEARARLTGVGQEARVEIPGRSWRGSVIGIDEEYHLLLRDKEGKAQRIFVGEVLPG